MIHDAVSSEDDRRCKQADEVSRLMKVESYCIERSSLIAPVGRADEALVAEVEDLAAGGDAKPAILAVDALKVGLPEIDSVLVRWDSFHLLIEEGSRVLRFDHRAEPTYWLDRCPKAEAAQQIRVGRSGETDIVGGLRSHPILTAQLE